MGFALCRFREETGCSKTGSQHYWVQLHNLGALIDVPELWKHYMTEHLVQPNERERFLIENADVDHSDGIHLYTLGRDAPGKRPEFEQVLYVEKTATGYTHEIGTKPDTGFISKLERLIAHIDSTQTKGL